MKPYTFAVAALAALISLPALALPNEVFQGKPDFKAGDALGAWVWHDADGHHVRFTTVDNKVFRHFTGKACGKDIAAVTPVRTDIGDGIKVGPEGHCVMFDFKTNAGVDGFDFRMPDGPGIVYEINIDGRPMAPKMIHIGKAGVAPKKNPFVLDR
jgi:hypothetical protein